MAQVGVQEPLGRLVLTCTGGDAGLDVAVVSLRVCAVVGEQAGCELMPCAGRQLGGVGCIRGTVCAEREVGRDG